ncbi:MAG TPA: M56 family metallopeptidase [Mucilaginibacter sp.]|nr:M56 family metallopeptidase [Mucilaginibacter sp.]
MPALFAFLLKVNIALVLFCLGYYLVLRHLTFYTLNRLYLVTAIAFSSIYPFIDISGFIQLHQQFAKPVQQVIYQWKLPAENFVKPLSHPDYWQWATAIFWTGVILLALRLMLQLFSLYRLHKQSIDGRVHHYDVRIVEGDVSPFSFWRSIYVNPDKLSPADLKKVLEHEHIHVSEWHTLDILLAELSTVFYWFNPGIWLMKKAVRENIEFITDRKILQKGADSKQYQYSLLTVSMAGAPNMLVNNFNISTIKKRIIMMNTKRSARIKLTRYMLVAPAIVLLLLAFSISRAEITKKGIHTIKAIASSFSGATISGANKTAPSAMVNPLKETAMRKGRTYNNADTIYAGRSKDGKKSMMVTSDKSVDSVQYVIDGAQSSRADLLALDPGKIYSLDMIPADIAKKYIDFSLDKPEVLFVTTDDSEKGKSLKERIDKDVERSYSVSGKTGTTVNTDLRGPVKVYSYSVNNSGTSSNDIAPQPPGSNYAYSSTTVSSDNAPEVAVAGTHAKTVTAYSVSGSGPTKVTALNGSDVVNADASTEVVTVDSSGERHINYITTDPQKIRYTVKTKPTDELTVDNPGMLIMIDGKEAKSLKNLSPANIRSFSVLKNEAAEKKYGKRGKYGVIEITTKKN